MKVNHITKVGFSALWNAIENHREDLACELIEKYDFDIKLFTPSLNTLALAAQYGMDKLVKIFLD